MSGDRSLRDAAAADLRDYLARTLSRGFGNQLVSEDIDDLAQESMVRIQSKLGSFLGRSRFTTWAAAIAVNLALSQLRKRKYQHVTLDDAVSSGESALSESKVPAQRNERDRWLREAIEQALTDRQKTALLAELGGLPLAEVARRMDSSRGALYKLLHDARKRLRGFFDERGIVAADLLTAEPDGAP